MTFLLLLLVYYSFDSLEGVVDLLLSLLLPRLLLDESGGELALAVLKSNYNSY